MECLEIDDSFKLSESSSTKRNMFKEDFSESSILGKKKKIQNKFQFYLFNINFFYLNITNNFNHIFSKYFKI